MSKVKKIALIGIGGFSRYHYDRIKELESEGELQLSAVMIRRTSMDRYREMVETLRGEGLRIYETFEALLAGEQDRSDVVSIPTGIGDHCEMSLAALGAGYHVICEKPVAGTLEECMRMKDAQKKSGRLLAICFQNIYSPVIQRIKQIALEGTLGALKSAKACVLWQRADTYYSNGWRGRLTVDGKTINDCPLMNATAHYLNNMLYVAGQSAEQAAVPVSVYGENYRVKKIESCDTQFLRVMTDRDVRLTFITSHSTDVRVDPMAEYLFENGKIVWDFSGNAVVFRAAKGGFEQIEAINGGDGNMGFFRMIYRETARAIETGREPAATINNSYQHVLCVDKSLESGPILDVPEEYIGSTLVTADDDCLKTGDVNRYIKGIKPLMEKMFAQEQSFYEAGCPWARPSDTVLVK